MDIKDPADELRSLLQGLIYIEEYMAHSDYEEKKVKNALKRVKKEYKRLKKKNTEKSKYLSEEAKDLYD